jgi:hypothetical protein
VTLEVFVRFWISFSRIYSQCISVTHRKTVVHLTLKNRGGTIVLISDEFTNYGNYASPATVLVAPSKKANTI